MANAWTDQDTRELTAAIFARDEHAVAAYLVHLQETARQEALTDARDMLAGCVAFVDPHFKAGIEASIKILTEEYGLPG